MAAQRQSPEYHDSSISKAKDADMVDTTNKELKSQLVKLANGFKEGVDKKRNKRKKSAQYVNRKASRAEDKPKALRKQSIRK